MFLTNCENASELVRRNRIHLLEAVNAKERRGGPGGCEDTSVSFGVGRTHVSALSRPAV